MLQLVLASQSPRRRELLRDEHYDFRTYPVKVSENIDENLNIEVNATQIATDKARAAIDQYNILKSKGFLVLAADTLVGLGDQILGKPRSAEEAAHFLSLLSGSTHKVVTGLALIESASARSWSGYVTTEIEFRKLTMAEIQTYVQSGEPMDKAGGYGIQGEAAKFVAKVEGSWANVVGLPIERFQALCVEFGWQLKMISKDSK